MTFDEIARIFPMLAGGMPFIMQTIKPMLEQYFFPTTSLTHDRDIRFATILLTAVVGMILLFATGATIHTFSDGLLAVAAFAAYGLGGGPAAMGCYHYINGFLHQSPNPALKQYMQNLQNTEQTQTMPFITKDTEVGSVPERTPANPGSIDLASASSGLRVISSPIKEKDAEDEKDSTERQSF